MLNTLNLIVSIMAGVIIAFGLLYMFGLMIMGVHVSHRENVSVKDHEDADGRLSCNAEHTVAYTFFFLVPALNEERVIATTVQKIIDEQPGSRVVVVDDGSTDSTAEIVRSFADRVTLVQRVLPDAQQGKGAALNSGIVEMRRQVELEKIDPKQVIIVVMDADGQMSPNATAVAADIFRSDPSIGGMQLVVRIRNRDSLLLQFQDLEFWAASGLSQLGRTLFGSTSLGGNGQFTRLSALNEIGERPWSGSLTEDLDLGISLAVLGWRTVSTPNAYVTQQGVAEIGRLIKQRSRWYQGHMMAIKRVKEMAQSPYLPTSRLLEMSAYVTLPWTTTLPWSIIQQYILITFLLGYGLPSLGLNGATASDALASTAIGLTWILISFAPQILWGFLYYRRARTVRVSEAALLALLMIPAVYLTYFAAWKAFFRIITGKNSWVKTTREAEAIPS